jgi:hypothetical protein
MVDHIQICCIHGSRVYVQPSYPPKRSAGLVGGVPNKTILSSLWCLVVGLGFDPQPHLSIPEICRMDHQLGWTEMRTSPRTPMSQSKRMQKGTAEFCPEERQHARKKGTWNMPFKQDQTISNKCCLVSSWSSMTLWRQKGNEWEGHKFETVLNILEFALAMMNSKARSKHVYNTYYVLLLSSVFSGTILGHSGTHI